MLRTLKFNLTLAFSAAVIVYAMQTQKAHAHAIHTPNICSLTASDICAHLGFSVAPNSVDESVFMLHFMPKTAVPAVITNVTVKPVMHMGTHEHGTSPVTLTAVDDVHFEVSKAYFPMVGAWQIRVGFDFEGARHEIVIPIDVE